jgi:hypothetical protein
VTIQIGTQSHKFRDAKGFTWTMKYHIRYDDTSAASVFNGVQVGIAVEAALNGTGPGTLPLSNGVRQGSTGLYSHTVALAYGTAAQYLNAEDKLMVAFYDSGGSLHRFGIGAPVVAAFLADQETGKGSQLVDFVAAMTTAVTLAYACTPNGLAFSTAVGSLLVRRRQRRKYTLVSKSANLDEPGE